MFFMCCLYRFQFARFLKKHNINLIVSFVVSTSSKITSIFYDFFHAPLRISTMSSDNRCHQHLTTPPLLTVPCRGQQLVPTQMPGWEDFFDCTIKSPSGSSWHLQSEASWILHVQSSSEWLWINFMRNINLFRGGAGPIK